MSEDALITVILPKDATGYVVFSVNNEQYINNTIVDGVATYSVPNLAYGNHTVNITYSGDEKYKVNTTSCNVEVVKNDVEFNPTTKPIFVGDDAIISVVLPKDATGTVTVTIGTNSSVVEVIGGITNVSVSGLANGTYDAVVTYSGDNKYNANTSKVDIKVFKISDYDIIIDTEDSIVAGENTTVTITLPNDVNGQITVLINKKQYNVPVKDGKATVVADNVVKGENTIEVSYAGNDKYNKGTNSSTFNADAVDADISIKEDVIPARENLIINLPKDATGTVTVKIGGKTITAPVKNGQAVISTKDIPAGNYPAEIIYSGDTKYAEKSIKDTVYLQNEDYSLNVAAADIFIGEEAIIRVNLPKDATGIVFVTVDGVKYNVSINGGVGNLVVPGLALNKHNVKVEYPGDKTYTSKSNSTTFNVVKYNPEISLNKNTVKKGENFVVTLPKDASGTVTAVIGGKTISAPVKNGQAVISTKDIPAGKYSAKFTYSGDVKYNARDLSADVKVQTDDYFIIVSAKDISAGDKAVITVTLPGDATGSVSIVVGGKTYTAPINNGKATLDVSGLTKGTYTVSVTYAGNDKYLSKSNSTSFNVKALDPSIAVADDSVKQGEDLVVELPKDATGTVTATIGGKTFTAPVKDGKAVIPIKGVPVGTYDAKVTYSGDDKYGPKEVSDKVTVMDLNIEVPDVTKYYRNDTQFYATILDKNGNSVKNTVVKLNINGVIYERTTNNQGIVKLNLNLVPNTYILTVTNPSTSEMATSIVKILPRLVENHDLVKYYRNASRYSVKVLSKSGNAEVGKTVTFNINGVFYQRVTNSEGVASLNINLGPDTYIITAEYDGSRVSNKITVLNILKANDLIKRYGTSSQFTVTLLDGNGRLYANQVIKFNINGVFYNRTSDENGYVKLNINLRPGDYIITAEYNGYKVSNNIKVLPVLVGSDLTKQVFDLTPFSVKLVDGQGFPLIGKVITLNINGVMYNRTTDLLGYARLNINLWPGQYIVTSMYAENGAITSNKVTITSIFG